MHLHSEDPSALYSVLRQQLPNELLTQWLVGVDAVPSASTGRLPSKCCQREGVADLLPGTRRNHNTQQIPIRNQSETCH